NVAAFYTDTLAERNQFRFPPFIRLIEIEVLSKELHEAAHLASEIANILKVYYPDLLGPQPPLVARVKEMYRQRILLKIEKNEKVKLSRDRIANCLEDLKVKHRSWNYRIRIDSDPN